MEEEEEEEEGVTSNCYSCLLLLPIDNLEWWQGSNSFVSHHHTVSVIYRAHKNDCALHFYQFYSILRYSNSHLQRQIPSRQSSVSVCPSLWYRGQSTVGVTARTQYGHQLAVQSSALLILRIDKLVWITSLLQPTSCRYWTIWSSERDSHCLMARYRPGLTIRWLSCVAQIKQHLFII